jgi:predicted RNA methylase
MQFVKSSIQIDWDEAKPYNILDADFYLADLISEDDVTLKDKLFVLLKKDIYELDRKLGNLGLFNSATVDFKDGGAAHTEFWKKYERPPRKEFWGYIIERRDLLIPEDVRERKGAFFTPPQWVAKAHEYLEKCFGEDWQDEYIVWDNSAGTGNLLAGLVNKDNIWASTLDKQDVQVMRDRIENGANLWDEQVFQFDFLNDDIKAVRDGGKIPDALFAILKDEEKRKKLIFLINPPYGEAGNARTRTRKGSDREVTHKAGVQESKTKERFKDDLGKSLAEKYVQFFVRILYDFPDCKMGAFVKPKYICGGSMQSFRKVWKAKYLGGFATPARTHDNCTGEYPICFFVWDLAQKKNFPKSVRCDVFNEKERREGLKKFYAPRNKTINDWIREYNFGKDDAIGLGRTPAPDGQRNSYCWIGQESIKDHYLYLNGENFVPFAVYFAVRHCIKHKWINDADQYFYPKSGWEKDIVFQNDCIVFTLFNSYNKIKLREGVNHWIPFTEDEAGCTRRFKSRFMSGFLRERGISGRKAVSLSAPAQAVLDAGRELWRHYHAQAEKDRTADINASFYDIREYFQGSKSGKMGVSSTDERYRELIKALRDAQDVLAAGIEPKVYEYGFLRND